MKTTVLTRRENRKGGHGVRPGIAIMTLAVPAAFARRPRQRNWDRS